LQSYHGYQNLKQKCVWHYVWAAKSWSIRVSVVTKNDHEYSKRRPPRTEFRNMRDSRISNMAIPTGKAFKPYTENIHKTLIMTTS
jgi:hypothetical protein